LRWEKRSGIVYEKRRLLKWTIMNLDVKWEVVLLWENKNDQKKDHELRGEKENGIIMWEDEGLKERS
jgi:hypothetical protein